MSGFQPSDSEIGGTLSGGPRARWTRMTLLALAAAGLALAFAWQATPRYMSEARILIGSSEMVSTEPQSSSEELTSIDEEILTRQRQVIASDDLLRDVALKLNLAGTPESDPGATMSFLERMLVLIGRKGDPGEMTPEQRVIEALRERLNISRAERGPVIAIGMSSQDPQLAADIPNALADAYIASRNVERKIPASDAADLLQPEIEKLSQRVRQAEARVAAYSIQSADGTTPAAQQISEEELRALEREAEAQRQLLESYLTRYREASSRNDGNDLPADARILSRASLPSESHFPKPLLIAGATFVVVLLVMAVIALAQEPFLRRGARHGRIGNAVRDEASDERSSDEPLADRPMQTQEQPIMRNFFARRAASPAQELPSEALVVPDDDAVETGAGEVEEGRIGVARAAEMLITGGATRAIFVSPEGDEGAAAAVLVARQVADAGLRVLLIDLTTSGAASLPMLDRLDHPGITNLLASEGNFTDTIHVDHYSECSVMPIGTTDPARAMKSAARLPIIVKSLTNAYDVVVIECGASDAEGISRLVADGTEIMVSAVEPDGEVAASLHELEARGYGRVSLVSPGLSPID